MPALRHYTNTHLTEPYPTISLPGSGAAGSMEGIVLHGG